MGTMATGKSGVVGLKCTRQQPGRPPVKQADASMWKLEIVGFNRDISPIGIFSLSPKQWPAYHVYVEKDTHGWLKGWNGDHLADDQCKFVINKPTLGELKAIHKMNGLPPPRQRRQRQGNCTA